MAERKARIVLELKDEATAKFNAAFQNMNSAMGQLTQVTKEGKKATDDASESTNKYRINIVDLAAKLYLVQVGIRNVARAVEQAYEFGKMGAVAEQVAYSFERVVINAGGTVDMLEDLRRVSRGTISDVQLMSAVNQALVGTSGNVREEMLKAIPQLLEMARASAILNPQLGDTAHQFDRLTLGLKRLEPRIIDDIGLELRLTEVNANYAKQIGKTVDALTVEERSLALLNAVIERHGDYVKLAGENTEAAVDPYSRFEAGLKNLGNTIAKEINPSMSSLVDFLNQAVIGVDVLIGWETRLVDTLSDHSEKVVETSDSYDSYRQELEKAADTAGLLIDEEGNLIRKYDASTNAIKSVVQHNYLLSQSEYELAKAVQEEAYGRHEAIIAMGHQSQQIQELIELEAKEIEKRTTSMNSMFTNILRINERRLDQESRTAEGIADENERLASKLTDIHNNAEEKRRKLAENASGNRTEISEEEFRIISEKEEELTRKAIEESEKRVHALKSALVEVAEEANKQIKISMVESLLSIVPAGSAAEGKLLEMKWKLMGATEEMITAFFRVRDSVSSPGGINSAIRELEGTGTSAFFNLQGAISGVSGQLMGANYSAQVLANSLWAVGQAQGGGGGGVMRRQHGGTVGNQPVLVGEAGPEIFVPGRPGGVVPNNMLSGGGSTVNINISAGAFQGSQADAVKFANWVGPLVMSYLDRYGGNVNAVGSRRIRSG